MWGVSWANVSMMMADAQRTDYERDKKDALQKSGLCYLVVA